MALSKFKWAGAKVLPQSERVAGILFVSVLVIAFTAVLWLRWNPPAPRQSDDTPPDTVESTDDAQRDKRDNSSEVGKIISGSRDEAISNEAIPDHVPNQAKIKKPGSTILQPLATPNRQRKLTHGEYTIGWICALTTEYVAAQKFITEEHEKLSVAKNDNNHYTLGVVGGHNVVITVLPDGEYGISSATGVVKDMSHSFSNIRICLMVGIGGGAPSKKHDIRLGDVVVSAPRDGNGGVFQYDFGKTMQDQAFHATGYLNQPPICLRTAMSGLKALHEIQGHSLDKVISQTLNGNPRLQKYQRPDPSTDRLYQSGVAHPSNDANCEEHCGNAPSNLIPRRERAEHEDNPSIHYGLIASANQVMKDAFVRDRLIAEKDVLCFEMEAAGLMNQIPCLVIRGICDYSDSHKNKHWQGYAAMIAAAYARELLHEMPPEKVESESKISDILSDLYQVAEEHRDVAKEQRDIAKEHLQAHKDLAKEKLSEKEQKCHQLFRLIAGDGNATYDWFKDRVEKRVDDTCMWFLQHEKFQNWLSTESGPLFVSADPGCGKSVLAKYLIDQHLPCSERIICYFFFKDQVQHTIQQALCAILHQLFSQKPFLIKYAMKNFEQDGQNLIHSTGSLWEILYDAIDDPGTGSVVIVLDALDECAESDFGGLMRKITDRSQSKHHDRLKYLLTSRPYDQIVSEFRGLLDTSIFTKIHIPAEKHSEQIRKEISRVIRYRGDLLAKEKRLNKELKDTLIAELLAVPSRTYLWVYLVFDNLKTKAFQKTKGGVKAVIRQLPTTINDAYDQILSRSKDQSLALKALCIILAANRPLTLSEMNVAMNINIKPDERPQSFEDLELEEEEDFKANLRSWCGLFISIHQGNIFLLHQTAREFLLGDVASPTTTADRSWYHSVTMHQAHTFLAEVCVIYLNLFNSTVKTPIDAGLKAILDYSANYWAFHFQEANIIDDDSIIPATLKICDPNLDSCPVWFDIYADSIYNMPSDGLTNLLVASHLGLYTIVRLLLDQVVDLEAMISYYGQTSLSLAAEEGYEAVVKLLVEKGADVETKDKDRQTPLLWAARQGHEAVAKLLVEKGADIETKDKNGQTPLLWAARKGHKVIVKLLVKKGADVETKDEEGRTPLLWALKNGYEAVVELLVERGANIETKDKWGKTPLLLAAPRRNKAIVELLVERGANIEAKDKWGKTPLLWAAMIGSEAIVKLLIEKGANIRTKDKEERTLLLWVAGRGYEAIVKLLVEKGADVEAKDKWGKTPLSQAARKGHEAVAKLLVEKGANVRTKDKNGQTPLSQAAEKGHKAIVKLLVEKGADFEAKDKWGKTPLLWAARNGHEAVAKLLVEKGADVETKDEEGQTPLSWASKKGHEAIVKLLVEKGADVETKDGKYGQTPLSWAAENGHEAVAKLLVEKGADVETKDQDGQTPLAIAAWKGYKDIVKLLVDKGADVETKDKKGYTPLFWAAQNGHEAIVKLLEDAEVLLTQVDSSPKP